MIDKKLPHNEEDIKASLKALHQKMIELIYYFDKFCKKHQIQYFLAGGTLLGAVRHKGFIPWDDDFDVMMTYDNYYKFIDVIKKDIDSTKFFFQEEDSQEWPSYYSKLRMNNTAFIEKNAYKKKYAKMHQGIFIDIFCLDNSAPTKLGRILQYLISKILIAQSLFKKGFSDLSLKKKLFIYCSILLFPFKSLLFYCIKKYNNKKLNYYSDFFDIIRLKNVFIEKRIIESSILLEFEGLLLPCPVLYDEILTSLYGDYMQFPPEEKRYQTMHSTLIDVDNSYEKYI